MVHISHPSEILTSLIAGSGGLSTIRIHSLRWSVLLTLIKNPQVSWDVHEWPLDEAFQPQILIILLQENAVTFG
jgi:hypothetical protein